MNYFHGYGYVYIRVYIDGWHQQVMIIVSKCGVGANIGSLLLGVGHDYAIIVPTMFSLLAWYIILKGVST